MLQVVVFMADTSLISALRASGTDGVFVRPFIKNEQDKMLYRVAPLPVDVSLPTAIRQAACIGGKAFGVVPYSQGFGIREGSGFPGSIIANPAQQCRAISYLTVRNL